MRHLPVGQVAKVALQRRLECIATLAVKTAQLHQMLLVLLGADPLHGLPLANAIGVQVGRLLELEQVREQILAGDQVTDAQPRQQGLGDGAGVDPAGFFQAPGDRLGTGAVECQLAVGLVFDQGYAEFIEQGGHGCALGFAVAHGRRVLEGRDEVDERRAMAFEGGAQGGQVRAVGLQLHGEAIGAEQLENLQGGQVGRAFQHDLSALVDVQLGCQVEGLLGAADHQHLAGLAWHAQGLGLGGEQFTQLRLAFAHAVLADVQWQVIPIQGRQHGFGRQATGERHHVRALSCREDFTDQGAFEARNTFREGHRVTGSEVGGKYVKLVDRNYDDSRGYVNMLDLKNQSSQQQAMEAFFFGYQAFTAKADEMLERRGLSRVHQRIVFFIARYPALSVKQLLELLGVSKQALNMPLRQLQEMHLVDSVASEADKRKRLLELTEEGLRFEQSLRREQVKLLQRAFSEAGEEAVAGWLAVNQALAGQP
ncbi:hypothetical protein ALP97_04674 [Pseudomonas salomonii]|uniref:HTH marR-type domain-containing protein n=2 Tax=Pseudomonas TaxID=286 RepID=A0A3M4Q345_9PSED|nr:hypothetical protein ALP97_04674 [Pseudomonas salomonii]